MKKKKMGLLSSLLSVTIVLSTVLSSGPVKANSAFTDEDAMKKLFMEKYSREFSQQDTINKLKQKVGADYVPNENATRENPNELVRVIVQMEKEPAAVSGASTKSVLNSQSKVKTMAKKLDGAAIRNTYSYLLNGFSMTVKRSEITKLENMPGVKKVSVAKEYKPDMTYAKSLTQAYSTWSNLKLKGEGMVVAIVDTGIDVSHKDMKLTSTTGDKLNKDNALTSGDKGKFFTDKVPYGYNFADNNTDIKDSKQGASMHGMHVAGIVGANGSEDEVKVNKAIQGVAPECQLLAMKVFSNNPDFDSAFSDDIAAAIESSVLHKADVINMSLGATGGFNDPEDPEQVAIKNATDKGVIVVVSAGNSNFSTSPYKVGGVVDTGLIGSPSTATDSFSVASYENTNTTCPAVTYTNGSETGDLAYLTSDVNPLSVFKASDAYSLVDCGLGQADDFKGKDLKGKIALIKRGVNTFVDKKINAQAAGAIGAIVYNKDGDNSYISMATDPSITIPCVFVSNADGVKLLNSISTVKVNFKGNVKTLPNVNSGSMSDFTSWGPNPELLFKPNITAPGGSIYSTVNDNGYESMNGTSMAAPHTSGGEALILQAAKKLNLTGRDLVNYVKNTSVNTAKVEVDSRNNLPYSPRRQGSGLLQIEDAINNTVTITGKDGSSCLSLKEIGSSSTFDLTLKNYGSKDVTYSLPSDTKVLSEYNKTLVNTMPFEVEINGAKLTFDKTSVTVKANSTETVKATLTIPNTFTADQFAEGFVAIKSETVGAPSLNVPFIGFYGKWSRPAVFDAPMWSSNSILGMSTAFQNVDGDLYYAGMIGKDGNGNAVVDPEKIAISKDMSIIPYLTIFRNCKTLNVDVLDANHNLVGKAAEDSNVRKDVVADTKDGGAKYSSGWAWNGKLQKADGTSDYAPDGQYYLKISGTIDYEGAEPQSIEMPVKVDNVKPSVTILSSTTCDNTSYTLQWKASDSGSGLKNGFIFGVNGKLIDDAKVSYDKEKDVYSTTLALKENDVNEVEVDAEDYANNIGASAIEVQSGSLKEALKVNLFDGMQIAPLDSKYGDEFTVAGTFYNGVAKVTVNGNEATLKDNTFSYKYTNITPDENGNFKINVVALDNGGKELYNKNFNIIVKNEPLTLSNLNIKDGLVVNNSELALEGKVSFKPQLMAAAVNGEVWSPIKITVNADNTISGTISLPNYGLNTVEIAALNYAAQPVYDTTYNVYKTASKPIAFNNFSTGLSVGDSNLTITGYADATKIKNFKIAGQPVNVDEFGGISQAVKLNQGMNYVSVYAENQDGSVYLNTSYKISCDSVAPKVSLQNLTPVDGKLTINNLVNGYVPLKVRVNDSGEGFKLYVNGNQVATKAFDVPVAAPQDYDIDVNLPVDLLGSKLNIVATDLAGNTSNALSYDVTNAAPVIKVSNLADKMTVKSIKPDITVTPSDATITTTLDGNSYDSSTITAEGAHKLVITAVKGGATSVSTYNFTVDSTKPSQPVISLSKSTPTNKPVVVTIAAGVEAEEIHYTVGGEDQGKYTEPFALKANTTVTAYSVDKAGNESEISTLNITNIDTTAPVITVDGVKEGQAYNVSVTPKVSTNEPTVTSITLNGKTYDGSEITAEGKYTLVVNAVDAAGNAAKPVTVNFTIDKTAPVISVSGVEDGKLYNTSVTPVVKPSEISTVTMTLNGKAYDGSAITEDGSYTLIADAVDIAGNKANTLTVKFSIDKTAPVITVSGVTEGAKYDGSLKAPTFSAGNDEITSVTLDGTKYDGNAITKAGYHVFVVTAKDLAGNVSTKTINFSINVVWTNDDTKNAEAIKDSSSTKVDVPLNGNTTVSAAVLTSLAGVDKQVSFVVPAPAGSVTPTVTWTFNTKDLDKSKIKDIDLSLNATSPVASAIAKTDKNAQILSFKYHGDLPASATIKVLVDKKLVVNGKIFLYYYNADTKKAELIKGTNADGSYIVDADGYVSVTITHCSDYFLSSVAPVSPKAGSLPKTGNFLDTNLMLALGAIIMACGAAFVWKRKRCN